jgi:hypothetical protein
MIHKNIEIPLYHQYLQIIICDDAEKEIDQINKKIKIKTSTILNCKILRL